MRPFLFAGVLVAMSGAMIFSVARGVEPMPLDKAAPSALHFASGPAAVPLIELYTSEGCSSCPPAEAWLGKLREQPGLWRDFVPVAFHVDYWNRLGWPDRFSTKEFTQREYAYSAAWGSDSVYTPCFVRDGAEWRGRSVPGPAKASASPVGTLTVDYDGQVLRADFAPATGHVSGRTTTSVIGEGKAASKASDYEVHAAILGAGIVSKVTSGENRGETLKHEFIALKLVSGPMGKEIALTKPVVAGVPQHALAVWVTKRGSLVPVQAAGAWVE